MLSTALVRDAVLLFGTNAALGVDGYYYAVQVKTLISEGRLYYDTFTPLTICFFAFLSLLTGEPVVAIKIGVLLLQVFLSIGIYKLTVLSTQNSLLGLLGIFIVGFSSLHFLYISEFLNNLGALTFLIWAVIGLLMFRESGRKSWLLLFLLLTAAAFLSHRSMLFVIPTLFLCYSVPKLLFWTENKRENLHVIILILLAIVIPSFLFVTLLNPYEVLPKEFLFYPRLPFREVNLPETIIIIISAILGLWAFRYAKPDKNARTPLIFSSVVIWTFLTTLNPFLNHRTGVQGIFGRLDTLAFIQAALAAPLSLYLLPINRLILLKLVFTICVVGLVSWSYFAPLPLGSRPEYIDRREKLIEELPDLAKGLCEQPLIIAKHGEQFVVTYILGFPSRQAKYHKHPAHCRYWLIYQRSLVAGEHTIYDLSETNRYTLIADTDINNLIKSQSENKIDIFENPHLKDLFLILVR